MPASNTYRILVFIFLPLFFICSCEDKPQPLKPAKQDLPLVGTWLQTYSGGKDVSDAGVKVTITEKTLAMNAPGCLITGSYILDGDRLSLTIISVEGETCSGDQRPGESSSVFYRISGSEMTLIPEGAGKESRSVFSRIKEGGRPGQDS